jgi:hypothetical protein
MGIHILSAYPLTHLNVSALRVLPFLQGALHLRDLGLKSGLFSGHLRGFDDGTHLCVLGSRSKPSGQTFRQRRVLGL